MFIFDIHVHIHVYYTDIISDALIISLSAIISERFNRYYL